ncbi:hypothetical protein C8F04DRAFT_1400402 [Mycena alexandri]|uniref:BTB domain-containing protein n=1 Tax=Mycena alexandri TaxID=1745969 RepID=A0AAD6SD62_9AGAR|nr:hypothetical protein C8F04DRAFT_1400402 [Mycena alexandri]
MHLKNTDDHQDSPDTSLPADSSPPVKPDSQLFTLDATHLAVLVLALAQCLLNLHLVDKYHKPGETNTKGQLIQPSDIWFEDGNLIVQAENMQYRVYKGSLSRISTVFKTNIENITTIKGVNEIPVLRLSDSANEVAHLFRAIFDRWSYPETDPLPFDAIAAFLGLGHKYKIRPFYDSALSRLRVAFPSSLEEYIDEGTRTKRIVFSDPKNVQRGELLVDTILLARELGLLALLPSAFWFAATHLGFLTRNHTEGISDADRNIIMSAAKPLRVAHADYLFGWLDTEAVPVADCLTPEGCRQKKVQYSLALWKPPGLSPVFHWRPGAAQGLCKQCATIGRKHHDEGAKRLWDELPSFFGLPPWGELLKEEE